MKITCISASNTSYMGKESASTKVCQLIKDKVEKVIPDSKDIQILPLMDYKLMPCDLCGKCSENMTCIHNDGFNQIFEALCQSDGLFLVVPHYSPIPSKLIIIFEKLNEIYYSGYLKDQAFKFPLSQMKVGIIGHGGYPESDQILMHYHDRLVTPVGLTLKSLGLDVIALDDTFKYGVTFGLQDEKCLKQSDSRLFPDIVQDYDAISKRIEPLVLKLTSQLMAN